MDSDFGLLASSLGPNCWVCACKAPIRGQEAGADASPARSSTAHALLSNTSKCNSQWQPVQRACLVDEEPVLEAMLIQAGGCAQASWPCANHQHSNLQQKAAQIVSGWAAG